MNLPLRLKLFRTAAGLKQAEVAQKLSVSMNFVSMLERGKRDPTIRYLTDFAKLVDIPIGVLFWEPEAKTNRSSKVQTLHREVSELMEEYAGVLGVR